MDRPKILIIDDEEFIRTLLSEVLDGYASKIVELENGQHVLDIVESESPDLIIVDIVMPEKDGLEVIIEVKRKYPSLPIFAISAYLEYLDVAPDLGADEVFSKPIDTERLIQCISRIAW